MFERVYTGILQSEIPVGGMGRPLTAAECSKLLRHGVTCDEAHIVVRLDVTSPGLGRVYTPVRTHELHAPLGVIVS